MNIIVVFVVIVGVVYLVLSARAVKAVGEPTEKVTVPIPTAEVPPAAVKTVGPTAAVMPTEQRTYFGPATRFIQIPQGQMWQPGVVQPTAGYDEKQWRAYFQTHAPSEWWGDPEVRGIFVAIYGQDALDTLDWTCTVPENIDPNFQTSATRIYGPGVEAIAAMPWKQA